MPHKLLQALLVAAPAALLGWLLWQDAVPGGVFAAHWEPGQRSSFIDPLRPDQRVRAGGEPGVVAVVGDPVYTFLHPHRHFDRVSLRVEFRNEGVPIVEAGGLVKAGPDEAYALQPVQNLLIDQSPWARLDHDGLVLLQRRPVYASITDFLAKPPAGARVAAYRFDGALPNGHHRLLPALDLDGEGVDYVIARYRTPEPLADGWLAATVELDPSQMLAQRGAWKVALSVPGAASEPARFWVRALDATFSRATLKQEIQARWPL